MPFARGKTFIRKTSIYSVKNGKKVKAKACREQHYTWHRSGILYHAFALAVSPPWCKLHREVALISTAKWHSTYKDGCVCRT